MNTLTCPKCSTSLHQTLPVSYYSGSELDSSRCWAYRCLICGYWTDAVMEYNRTNPPIVSHENPLLEHRPVMVRPL